VNSGSRAGGERPASVPSRWHRFALRAREFVLDTRLMSYLFLLNTAHCKELHG
jgi:hypothetical protein